MGLLTAKEAADWMAIDDGTFARLGIEPTSTTTWETYYAEADLQRFADEHGDRPAIRTLEPDRRRASISPVDRDFIYRRDRKHCQICGTKDGPFHIDHKMPWSRGGTDSLGNLWLLCAGCNLSKHALTVDEFRARLRQRAKVNNG